jgi:hypothetical protein
MKVLISLLLVTTFALSGSTAQVRRQKAKPAAGGAKAAEAEAERILRRHVEALGDPERVRAVRSRVMRGLVEWSPLGVTGRVDIFFKAPNKSLAVFEVPGRGQFIEAHDGRHGWLQTPLTGALNFDHRAMKAFKRNADGGYDLNIRESFSRLTLRDARKVGLREAHVIEAKPADGPAESLYFDKQSGLLIRLDRVRDGLTAQGVPSSIVFDDFMTLDGLKIPTLIVQEFPEVKVKIRVYEVKHNTRLEDALFDPPSGARDARSVLGRE